MKYKRVVISEFGGIDNLQVVEDEVPEPQPGEVRVKVQAAGVAWADTMMRTGLYPGKIPTPPFAPGYDIAGVVDKPGEGVSTVAVGQNVTAQTKVGGYSEYLCVPEKGLTPVPEGLDPAEVTCLPLNYITAYQMLHRFAEVQAGERVLIHGAGGGVGTAQLQLGALAGVETYGTGSKGKSDLIARLGGTPIDYRNEDFVERIFSLTGDGVDAVFDPIGGAHLRRSYSVLRKGGRLIAYGERAMVGEGKHNVAETIRHNVFMFLRKNVPGGKMTTWYECPNVKRDRPDWFREDMDRLLELLATRKIEPVIAERLPLTEAAQAHRMLEAGSVQGKLVLIPN